MGEPLGYTPPCLCCRTSDDDGPHFDRRWKAVLKADVDGYFDLYQPEAPGPCAWVHRSCLFEFLLHHAKKDAEGNTEIDKLCIVCEIDVHPDELWRLGDRKATGRSNDECRSAFRSTLNQFSSSSKEHPWVEMQPARVARARVQIA
jgi:hypothetical protein